MTHTFRNGGTYYTNEHETIKKWRRKSFTFHVAELIEDATGLKDIPDVDVRKWFEYIKSQPLPPNTHPDWVDEPWMTLTIHEIFNRYVTEHLNYKLPHMFIGNNPDDHKTLYPLIWEECPKIYDHFASYIQKYMEDNIIDLDEDSMILKVGSKDVISNDMVMQQVVYYIFRGKKEGFDTDEWMIRDMHICVEPTNDGFLSYRTCPLMESSNLNIEDSPFSWRGHTECSTYKRPFTIPAQCTKEEVIAQVREHWRCMVGDDVIGAALHNNNL